MNEQLLLDTTARRAGSSAPPRGTGPASVRLCLRVRQRPDLPGGGTAPTTPQSWPTTLDHRDLAARENRIQRGGINLVLVRVLYAHALVAAPRLALS